MIVRNNSFSKNRIGMYAYERLENAGILLDNIKESLDIWEK